MKIKPQVFILVFGLAIILFGVVTFAYTRQKDTLLVDYLPNTPSKPDKCLAEINMINEEVAEQGYIRKEPDDRNLGSAFMYIFYFDKPFLLCENTSGNPQEISSIELYGVKDVSFDINSFVDKHVQVSGSLTWGYAESRVIDIKSIKIL